mgnify:CR=1 FL=1
MAPKELKSVTVIAKQRKPSLTKTMEWQGESLNNAISKVNTFIKNKGNFGMQTGKEKALMKKAEKMLTMGAFGNLDNLLSENINAYKPGTFDQSKFSGYKEVDPSEIMDGKFKQVSGKKAEAIRRIRATNKNAGMRPGVKITKS